MPRRARLKLDNTTQHLIQRGNNRSACFFAEEDYLFYLEHLGKACDDEDVALHAYVLMTNHVHLLLTPTDGDGPSRVMKRLGQRYVQYINRIYRRSGTLWEGRFRSCLVGEEDYLLGCYRYIELNPVRAAMVEHPADYRWSSYQANAQGMVSSLLTPHHLYEALGIEDISRQAAYRELFRYQLEPGRVDEIRAATNGGFALGSARFQQQTSEALGRRTFRGKAGRPVKCDEARPQRQVGKK